MRNIYPGEQTSGDPCQQKVWLVPMSQKISSGFNPVVFSHFSENAVGQSPYLQSNPGSLGSNS